METISWLISLSAGHWTCIDYRWTLLFNRTYASYPWLASQWYISCIYFSFSFRYLYDTSTLLLLCSVRLTLLYFFVYLYDFLYLLWFCTIPVQSINIQYNTILNKILPVYVATCTRTVQTFNSCTKCVDSPSIIHNRTPDCKPSFLVMDSRTTLQHNVTLIHKLRGSFMRLAYLFTCYPWVFFQPVIGRFPVDWCSN